jgi:hypothetical protein
VSARTLFGVKAVKRFTGKLLCHTSAMPLSLVAAFHHRRVNASAVYRFTA